MYRFGCVHQLLFLGLSSLSIVSEYEGNGSLTKAMIGVTISYLISSVGMLVWSMVGPVLQDKLNQRKTKNILRNLGLHYSLTTSLYIVPADGLGVVRRERESLPEAFEL
jgi:hypothetical protein